MTYEIVDDNLKIIYPWCTGFHADHVGLNSTVISCKLIFSRNGILHKSPYCVKLRAVDETIERTSPTYSEMTICLNTDLNKIHELDGPRALPLQSTAPEQMRSRPPGGNHKKISKQMRQFAYNTEDLEAGVASAISKVGNIFYPTNSIVWKSSTNMTRVAQPLNMTVLIGHPTIQFRIVNDPLAAFGITPLAGIIFVRDPVPLQKALEAIYL